MFKDHESGRYTVFHNDNEGFAEFISDTEIYIGFNSKHYDQYIAKGVVSGFSPEELKALNDYLIEGFQGWQYPPLSDSYFRLNNVDIRDDMYKELSLKAIEGHLGMNIVESSVDFTIDRPLTQAEIEEVIKYCKHDVDATEKIIELREDYIITKKNLGQRANIPTLKAISSTNAKLTAQMLGAKRKEWNDGRDYVFPENLDTSVIPKEILDFFEQIHDDSIPDDELFKKSLEIEIAGMPCKFAWGGVHGSKLGYFEQRQGTRIIQNRDVSSLYPSLIEIYNYISRNVADPQIYFQMKRDRIEAKHNGNTQLAKDLKLPLNTLSGAQENEFNDLYDPLPTRSMRISGQLFITVLLMRLVNGCETFVPLNFNTDGLMYSIDESELPIVDKICAEWEKETKFELETDDIEKVWIKDVNNLLFVDMSGKVKTVGAYLNYGISVKGQWAINNSAIAVKKAIIEYMVNGTPPDVTIAENDNIFDYQIIVKAGSKFERVYQLVDGEEVPAQKVNRVYATTDTKRGKLYKVKRENGSIAKIESLPDHCIIDNSNELSIDDIDKSYYIDLANRKIDDFRGIKKPKKGKTKMATKKKEEMETTTLNVYQKLNKARAMFLEENIKKTGKNMHLAFKFFELEDIVPPVTQIFNTVGLIGIVRFSNTTATITITNTDAPDDNIVFTSPFKVLEPIVSNTGKQATNEMQSLGSSITYMRRYLYMIAMDIVESDDFDGSVGSPSDTSTKAEPPKKTRPATVEERKETKSELTAPEDNATALQIKGLKRVLKELNTKNPSEEPYISQIILDSENFTNLTKTKCEELTQEVSSKLEKLG